MILKSPMKPRRILSILLLTSQTLEFLHPAFVGDTLTITAKVRRKSSANRLVLMDLLIFNQAGVKLILGKTAAKVMITGEFIDE